MVGMKYGIARMRFNYFVNLITNFSYLIDFSHIPSLNLKMSVDEKVLRDNVINCIYNENGLKRYFYF